MEGISVNLKNQNKKNHRQSDSDNEGQGTENNKTWEKWKQLGFVQKCIIPQFWSRFLLVPMSVLWNFPLPCYYKPSNRFKRDHNFPKKVFHKTYQFARYLTLLWRVVSSFNFIFDLISFWLLVASHRNINEKCALSAVFDFLWKILCPFIIIIIIISGAAFNFKNFPWD